ncbi:MULTISPECIES: hypothetical protein [Sphingobium]|uniref:Uncharacterized protein n=2 Tax=Sphingobium TaxID=165695 RepID=T0I0J8_9SPHN|nr:MULTISPECIES: hypothetical protein [Sphingobium]AMK26225.1 hypothetical protein K426_26630 [Sphingobium sp. TKS]EQB05180.1 hypothetical protein L485_03410 [Sphingobium baderi LL03]KKW89490.1 hypothetical protein YP76_24875 [Sphingobium chungbukense]KMS59059.1 hypothetical protein V475_20725 [Sphingobium baderi LL03]WRD78896.1 hypothetical protein QQ987_19730 [Sphingobium baderi]
MTEKKSLKVRTSKKSEKIDPENFNKLVAHARLSRLRLMSSSFDLKPDAMGESRRNWAYRISASLEDWSLDCDALELRGIFAFKVACVEGRRHPVSLGARYFATYRLSAECDEKAALSYLDRVARFSCYPYFRALFSILTEQSGLQLPPLPVMKEPPRLVR